MEKTDKGVRVMVKGQPNTEEVIPLAALKQSINKAAYSYNAVAAVMGSWRRIALPRLSFPLPYAA